MFDLRLWQPAGHYCAEGAAAALPCPEGTYSNIVGLTSFNGCTPTSPGYFSSIGSTAQTQCASGTVSPDPGSGSCAKCAAGTFQELEGMTACDDCTPGYYCKEGAAAALPCPEGTYSNSSGLSSAAQCVPTSPGSFSPIGSTAQTQCASGTVSPDPGSGSCTTCAAGTFQELEGMTACDDCTPGYYCKEGAAAALPCPEGTYSNSSGLSSAAQCVPTSPGSFSPIGSTAQTQCASGTVSPDPGSGSCAECAAGTFQELEGMTACDDCTPGYYCKEGAAAALPCPEGTYSNSSGLSSAAQCVPTSPGSFSPIGSTAQTQCASGTVSPDPGSGSCAKCAAGTFQELEGMPACDDCTPGHYCPSGSSVPTPCPDGTYSGELGLKSVAACKACPPGSECRPGSTSLSWCRAGSYAESNGQGQVRCMPCPGGRYSAPRAAQCELTMRGHWSIAGDAQPRKCGGASSYCDVPGLDQPKLVDPGFISTPVDGDVSERTGQMECPVGSWCSAGIEIKCEFGFYSSDLPPEARTNQTICKQCPRFSTTTAAGASDITHCRCDVGYVVSSPDGLVHGAGDCRSCPIGADCGQKGTNVHSLAVRPGFQRMSATSFDVKRCPDYANQKYGSGCIGGNQSAACRDSLYGPYCILCTEQGNVYYDTDKSVCVECTGMRRFLTMTIGLISLFGFGVLMAFMIYMCSLPAAKQLRPKRVVIRKLWFTIRSLLVKVKITLSFYQVVTLIGPVYKVKMPQNVVALLKVFNIGVEIDGWGLHLSCYGWGGFSGALSFLIVWPIVAVVVFAPLIGLALGVMLKTTTVANLLKCGLRGEMGLIEGVFLPYSLPFSLFIFFVAYPAVTALAFRAFEDCEEWTDLHGSSQQYLVSASKNYAMACPSDELTRAQGLAAASIAVYPVGVLVMCTLLLFSARNRLLVEDHNTFSRALGFMHAPFVPHFFFFDLLEMTKKLVLVGFASLISPGTVEQLVVAVLISIMFLVLHMQSSPYRKQTDNLVATASHIMLVVFFIWCTLLQTGALGDPDDIDNDLSGSGSVVTVLMLVACVAVLAFAGFLFAFETGALKLREMHEEAQRAKWSVCTLEPPYMDWAPDGSYACFLSHFKMEAASDARFLHDVLRKMLRTRVFLDSSSLADLRLLLRDGVEDSDIIVLLGTKGVLTRPWCLLEILHAHKKEVPVILVNIKGGGFDIDEQLAFANDLEGNMFKLNPDGIPVLQKEMHTTDLSSLQTALLSTLEKFKKEKRRLTWNPHAGDEEVIAALKDIVEGMAMMTGRATEAKPVIWKGDRSQTKPTCKRVPSFTVQAGSSEGLRTGDEARSSSAAGPLKKKASFKPWDRVSSRPIMNLMLTPIAYIATNVEDALADARVLQTELAMHSGRSVLISTPGGNAVEDSESSQAVIVLLTKNALSDPTLLFTVWKAAVENKPIVPICLVGRGYEFASAEKFLAGLEEALPDAALLTLKQLLNNDESLLDSVKDTLHHTIPNLIAINWEPEGGQNMLEALVKKTAARIPPPVDLKVDKKKPAVIIAEKKGSAWGGVKHVTKLSTSTSTSTMHVAAVELTKPKATHFAEAKAEAEATQVDSAL